MPAADAKSFVFPRSSRLKSSLIIKNVVHQRESFFCYPIKCFYHIEETACITPPKVAMLVSKKRFHHATDRNRVKRLMREAYRLHLPDVSFPEKYALQLCWMFVGVEMPDYQRIEKAFVDIFHHLETKLTEQA